VLRNPPAKYTTARSNDQPPPTDLISLVTDIVALLQEHYDLEVIGIVMHSDYPESDDRDAYRDLTQQLKMPDSLSFEEGHESLGSVIEKLNRADAALTIRYHGMIFALALDKPFVAIDYTLPAGKTTWSAKQAGMAESVLRWHEVDPRRAARQLEQILREPWEYSGAHGLPDDLSTSRIRTLKSVIAARS
jgi:polysaccharide pyruvyl transferase WcaK-like protein